MTTRIISKIINTEPTDKRIIPIAKQKFIEFAKKLIGRKLVNKYEIDESDGIKLTLYRNPDNIQVFIKIDSDGEVFSRVFDKAYVYVTAEHDMEYKIEALHDLLVGAQSYMEDRDYFEEIYERNGRVLFKRMVYPNGGSESASMVPLGRLRRFFGAKKRIVRPGSMG